jgi:hypothetical protein
MKVPTHHKYEPAFGMKDITKWTVFMQDLALMLLTNQYGPLTICLSLCLLYNQSNQSIN